MPINPLNFVRDLERLRYQNVEAGKLDPMEISLRIWQSNRLQRTYADLLQQTRYRLAGLFFLNDIYAARDFSQRDHDMEQMYAFTRRFIPDLFLRPLSLTVELNFLTIKLDRQLIDAMVNQLGLTVTITEELYAEGYRVCDNYDERLHQINLIYDIGVYLDKVVNAPFSGSLLRISKAPARQAGWGELVEFLEHGYVAFKRLHGATDFLNTVRNRETGILDRIYESDPDPFRFTDE
jgi:hypothetical protein